MKKYILLIVLFILLMTSFVFAYSEDWEPTTISSTLTIDDIALTNMLNYIDSRSESYYVMPSSYGYMITYYSNLSEYRASVLKDPLTLPIIYDDFYDRLVHSVTGYTDGFRVKFDINGNKIDEDSDGALLSSSTSSSSWIISDTFKFYVSNLNYISDNVDTLTFAQSVSQPIGLYEGTSALFYNDTLNNQFLDIVGDSSVKYYDKSEDTVSIINNPDSIILGPHDSMILYTVTGCTYEGIDEYKYLNFNALSWNADSDKVYDILFNNGIYNNNPNFLLAYINLFNERIGYDRATYINYPYDINNFAISLNSKVYAQTVSLYDDLNTLKTLINAELLLSPNISENLEFYLNNDYNVAKLKNVSTVMQEFSISALNGRSYILNNDGVVINTPLESYTIEPNQTVIIEFLKSTTDTTSLMITVPLNKVIYSLFSTVDSAIDSDITYDFETGNKPIRSNYEDTVFGSIHFGIDTLLYYAELPFKILFGGLKSAIDFIREQFVIIQDALNFLTSMFSFLPTPIVSLIGIAIAFGFIQKMFGK